MTRKHFVELAKLVREYNSETVCGAPFTLQHVALLADFCSQFNDNFDRQKFFKAAGVKL
jgi:hypothetical protein